MAKEKEEQNQPPVEAPKKAAPKVCKVSMSVDGTHLIAGEACPELSKAQIEHLTKLFGSLDKVIG